MNLMCTEELRNKEEALILVRRRANKWSLKSKVPLRHYIATLNDRGPLARLDSWEEEGIGEPVSKAGETA